MKGVLIQKKNKQKKCKKKQSVFVFSKTVKFVCSMCGFEELTNVTILRVIPPPFFFVPIFKDVCARERHIHLAIFFFDFFYVCAQAHMSQRSKTYFFFEHGIETRGREGSLPCTKKKKKKKMILSLLFLLPADGFVGACMCTIATFVYHVFFFFFF